MKKEFSLEEKMSAIGFVFQGESARSVSRRLHLGHHILYEWIESYKLFGIEGLKFKRKKKKRLSYEEIRLFKNPLPYWNNLNNAMLIVDSFLFVISQNQSPFTRQTIRQFL